MESKRKAVNIFMACEREFCFSVEECTINKIDSKAMVEVLMKDCLIKAEFTQLCEMTEVNVDKEFDLMLIYDRKIKEMNKAKSLRTEIMKKSPNLEKGH